jgi:outer membrane lipoprotein-sorting protein
MRTSWIAAIPTALLLIVTWSGVAQDATTIVSKSMELVQGKSSRAILHMKIVRSTWTRDIGIKSWSLGTDYGLILIIDPARDKGTAFLKRGKELWNWQPRIERSIKMPPSMMLQSWMGSDFTNDDLVRQSSIVEDYYHKLLSEEEIEGRMCYVIELTPKPNAPVVWGKVISWISKDGYLTLKSEYYDEDRELVNTMLGKNVRKMDDREIPTILEVIPADEKGNKTIITYESLDFEIPIDESFFSVQNMRSVD